MKTFPFRCIFNITTVSMTSEKLTDSEVRLDFEAVDIATAARNALGTFVGKAFKTRPLPTLTNVRLTRIVSLNGEPQLKLFLTSKESAKIRMCRSCGCTEEDCEQCVNRTGEPCSWVSKDLCSACL